MSNEYYTWPLRTDLLMKGVEHDKCNIDQSIKRHIHLIMTTAFGEIQHDEAFGCCIWDCDFDNLTSRNKLREKIKTSIHESVLKYETRLQQVKVEVFIKEEELNATVFGRQVKKRLDVQIDAVNRVTNDPFHFRDSFFTGPLSYY